ncbi:NUDIX domain-containing protein [Rurimicrobium arvi]|uniref:GDP-mannose pyrophosphatase n=1 Tax=Rurimicrobium arvi TaxID=2049916 RepID=A0ABP8MTJ5_9BACT
MNAPIRNLSLKELFKAARGVLKRCTFELKHRNGSWKEQSRDVYVLSDAAAIILYNPDNGNIILTRQFRVATYVDGHADGMLLEACAGRLDGEDPKVCIIRETEEETGYVIADALQIAAAYIGPGAITEKIFYFVAPYSPELKKAGGGGLEEEGEQIEVVEMQLDEALDLLDKQKIQDSKTIVLLQYLQLNRAKLFHS